MSMRTGILALAAAMAVLAGCAEREQILPGVREDLRPPELDPDAATRPGTFVNESRAISLPRIATNTSWPQATGTPAFRPAHPRLAAAPVLQWSAPIGAGDSRRHRITADPVVSGGRIYTLDALARVSATASDGSALWSRDLTPLRDDPEDATGGGLALAGDTLYVTHGFGAVSALDAATGAEKWTQEFDATASGPPTVVGDKLYVVAGDDTGWAIETANGRVAWQISATPSASNILGAPAPAISGDLVVFAFGSGDVTATFRGGGLVRWGASVAGQRPGRSAARISDITGAPVIDGNRVYAANHSGRLVAFNLGSGARLWTAREGAMGPVWPAGGSVFAVTDTNRLVRIDARNGDLIWSVDLPGYLRDRPRRRGEIVASHGPILAGGRLVVASNDGLLRFFDPRDGALLGQVDVPGGATTAPVVVNDTLYVVGTSGQLHAFR